MNMQVFRPWNLCITFPPYFRDRKIKHPHIFSLFIAHIVSYYKYLNIYYNPLNFLWLTTHYCQQSIGANVQLFSIRNHICTIFFHFFSWFIFIFHLIHWHCERKKSHSLYIFFFQAAKNRRFEGYFGRKNTIRRISFDKKWQKIVWTMKKKVNSLRLFILFFWRFSSLFGSIQRFNSIVALPNGILSSEMVSKFLLA
jgi:hypothetical protein